jgi:hypothetical protein
MLIENSMHIELVITNEEENDACLENEDLQLTREQQQELIYKFSVFTA